MYGMRTNEGPMVPACDGKLPILTQARKRYAYGEQEDYFDQPNCIGMRPLKPRVLINVAK